MDLVALTSLVAGHRPADEAERGHQAAVRELLRTSTAPLSRAHMSPGHITASAFVLSPDLGRVLLIHHSVLGLWIQPGGHVEPLDADLVSACRREVVEETGLTQLRLLDGFPVLLDIDVHEIPANPRRGEGAHRHFDLRTLWVAGTERLVDTGEVLEARWVAFADVASLNTDASVRRALARVRVIVGR